METTWDLPTASESVVLDLVESLGLAVPSSIQPLDSSTGQYHSIYIITYDTSTPSLSATVEHDSVKRLVLRISGGELPYSKTMNEVATIKWVRKNTSIPAPAVIAFDCTQNNVLKKEYSITEFVIGKPLSEVYKEVLNRDDLVDQLITFLDELYTHPFKHVGGLKLDGNGGIQPGPMTEWHFWTTRDEEHWQDPLSMNDKGPFDSYASYCIANIKASKKAIHTHKQLKGLRDLAIDQLIEGINRKLDSISACRYVLSHRDLHFGNIMYDTAQQSVTGIIDWELAAVLPYPIWNPGNFCWTGGTGEEADADKLEFLTIFERLCRAKQKEYLIDVSFASRDQQLMQEATTLLRKLVNAYVRGWQRESAEQFREELVCIIDYFNIN